MLSSYVFLLLSAVLLAILLKMLEPSGPEALSWPGESELWAEAGPGHADVSVRPFKIEFAKVMINDLKERLMHRRPYVPPLHNSGFSNGFNTIFIEQVLDFWKNSYDFKGRERFLNKFQHFKTKIQGLDVHFIHVKPSVNSSFKVLPILLLHGWPGSVRMFYDLIPLLATPRQDYNFVFEVIVPSLPGFGYSQAAARRGFGSPEAAVVMRNLMHRIGHEQFYIHAEGFGAEIAADLSTFSQSGVLGVHSSSVVSWQWAPDRAWQSQYLVETNRPDTIGIALSDNPSGLAAYILDVFAVLTNPTSVNRGDGGLRSKFSLTDLLDNVMIYWSTNTVTTAMRVLAEKRNYLGKRLDEMKTGVPTCGITFKHSLYQQSEFIKRGKYHNLLQTTLVEEGGNFAALENPGILADDIFKCCGVVQDFH